MSQGNAHPDLFAVAWEIAAHLHAGGSVTSAWVEKRFKVSRATAKRWVARVEAAMPVERGRELGMRSGRRKVLRLAPL